MKELLLLRHAKAKIIDGIEDKERPLKKRGKRDAQNIGTWLKKQHLFPDVLLSSPAKRTLDTAKIVHRALEMEDLAIQENEQLYASNVEQILSVLAVYPEEIKRILVVGHNPELENFLIHLVGKEALPNTPKLLPTGSLVRLSLDNVLWSELSQKRAQFISIIYAKSLLN